MDAIRETTTIAEIARHWRKRPETVRRAIECGRRPLVGRKSPDTVQGNWLVSVESVVRRWGPPQIPFTPTR